MGPRNQRSTDKPLYDADTDTFTGGCAIERDKRNLVRSPDTGRLETTSRSHTLGPTCQVENLIISPPANAKTAHANDPLCDNLLIRKQLLSVSLEILYLNLR
jgi:hypothetical protein